MTMLLHKLMFTSPAACQWVPTTPCAALGAGSHHVAGAMPACPRLTALRAPDRCRRVTHRPSAGPEGRAAWRSTPWTGRSPRRRRRDERAHPLARRRQKCWRCCYARGHHARPGTTVSLAVRSARSTSHVPTMTPLATRTFRPHRRYGQLLPWSQASAASW